MQARTMPTTWPSFMLRDPVAARYLAGLEERYPQHHMVLLDGAAVVGYLRAVPVPWEPRRVSLPARGWDATVEAAAYAQAGASQQTVSLLEAAVHPERQGEGLSSVMLSMARTRLAEAGVVDLIAPVRPTGKGPEPTVPMSEYAGRRRADNLPADWWLRTHVRQGAHILGICPVSMTVSGTLADWETWTGEKFHQGGPRQVAGALVPVHVDLDQDHAVYVEPNVWVRHSVVDAT